jgi:ankyrin repeat protein
VYRRDYLYNSKSHSHPAGINLKLLCREDVQPDSRNDALATPLAMAAERGHERVVLLLLAIIIPGVDIHSRAIKEKRTILSNPIAAARASGVPSRKEGFGQSHPG